MPRFYCPVPLTTGLALALPAAAARHVQVLRLQPGAALTLFNGEGGEFDAVVEHMGRSEVRVMVGAHAPVERECARAVHLAVGMPANDRMDWLIEKATEIGACSIQPLTAERSVLKLAGERADRKLAHWQAVAIAACEQCGRNRVPKVQPVLTLREWLSLRELQEYRRLLLSPAPEATPLAIDTRGHPVRLLSGPEGGLSPGEAQAAVTCGFEPVSLGPRILRAETAPLVGIARLT